MALTLHLGAHKTATTHFQKSLSEADAALREAGLYVALPNLLRGTEFPVIDALNQAGKGRGHDGVVKAHFAQIRERFPDQFLSDENMLGGTNRMGLFNRDGQVYPRSDARLAMLLEMLGGGPATIALSVRDPAEFAISAFSLQMTRGNELEIRDFLRGRNPARMDWTDLAQRLQKVPGVERLVIWRYEDYRALRPRLLERLLPKGMAPLIPDPAPVNQSLSQEAYDWLVAQAMADSDSDLRHLVTQALRRFPKSAKRPGLKLLTPEEHALSAEVYARDLDRLAALPGIEFIRP